MQYFTSDTHFFHKKICGYTNRPFSSLGEMHHIMIDNWNSLVKDQDTIYHLGDFAFGIKQEIIELLNKLNGRKHLILGNHDKLIAANPAHFIGDKMFASISNYRDDVKLANQRTILSHYAFRVWRESHHGSVHLYGHSHGTLPPFSRSVDVGVDARFVFNHQGLPQDYRPLHEDEIVAFMKTREWEPVDHHGTR